MKGDTTISVTPLGDGYYRLNKRFVYIFPWTQGTDTVQYVIIPEGMKTNFATTKCARMIIKPDDPDIMIASVVHDYLVREFSGNYSPAIQYVKYNVEKNGTSAWLDHDVSWDRANMIMKKIMKAHGAPKWKRWAVYWAVRIYGKMAGKK